MCVCEVGWGGGGGGGVPLIPSSSVIQNINIAPDKVLFYLYK